MVADAIDPPEEAPLQTALEVMTAKALFFETECRQHRAENAVREKAAAAALSRELDRNNPARNYKHFKDACADVGYSTETEYKKVWGWFNKGKLYGLYYDGTHIDLCVNDLRDKIKKTGRHG